jgi:hypothetical protein
MSFFSFDGIVKQPEKGKHFSKLALTFESMAPGGQHLFVEGDSTRCRQLIITLFYLDNKALEGWSRATQTASVMSPVLPDPVPYIIPLQAQCWRSPGFQVGTTDIRCR